MVSRRPSDSARSSTRAGVARKECFQPRERIGGAALNRERRQGGGDDPPSAALPVSRGSVMSMRACRFAATKNSSAGRNMSTGDSSGCVRSPRSS